MFWHLISNAINYCDVPPRIDVVAKKENDNWLISVSDNGIGINVQHAEDIFTIFRRLGVKKDVGGEGAGLAICKRILERHNGEIWVDSKPGSGSKFTFRIPV